MAGGDERDRERETAVAAGEGGALRVSRWIG